jgi:hypothetical protein
MLHGGHARRCQRWFELIQAHPAFKTTYYMGSLLTENVRTLPV